MLATHDLALFVVSGLLLNVTPGPDTLYIVARSTSQGIRAGVLAALGVGAGCCVHLVAAALGLSAILAASADAFTVVKLVGAAWLIYVGASLLRSRHGATTGRALPPSSAARVFVGGLLTNVLNPKVALFFLAFLPQFVDHDAPSKLSSLLFLGIVFNVNGTLWNVLVAWSAAQLGEHAHARYTVWINRTVGVVFIALGIKLALTKPPA